MTDPVVGQWERFEVGLDHAVSQGDPYRDVVLSVEYTRPDGIIMSFWGFYDGDDTWRLRFMPDQPGAWTYVARFSDDGTMVRGGFTCVPSDVPGLLGIDAVNPIWFGFRGGDHLMVRSLHVGDAFFAENLSPAQRTAFLDWAQLQGYNTLSIASHFLNRDAPGRGRGWATPRLWPLDAAEYRKLERILDDVAARGFIIFPFAGFFGRDADYPEDPAEQEIYLRYTLARLGSYWNLLFNVAGPEPLLPNRPFMTMEEISRLGRRIAALDVFDHPLSVHNATGDDVFRDLPWIDFGTLQGPKATDLVELRRKVLANHLATKPLYAQETLWSGNQHHPDYNDDELRRNACVLIMSAAAINFADNGGPRAGDQGDSSSGFSGTLDLADRRQERHDVLRRVWDLFEGFAFYRMTPRDDLVSAGFCLAEPGVHYLVYLPDGGTVDVDVEGGPYTVLWTHARAPEAQVSGEATRTGQGLAAPAEGEDWLLYLHHAT